MTENIFESKPFDLKYRLQLLRLKTQKKKEQNRIPGLLVELIDEIKKIKPDDLDERLELVYNKTADITDEYLRKTLYSLKKELSSGNIINFIMNLSSSFPGVFLSIPFFTAVKHMYHSRHLVQELHNRLNIPSQTQNRKILWFTDTLDDLKGISQTLKKLAWISFRNGNHMRIVTSIPLKQKVAELPPNMIFLPHIFNTVLPGNENMKLNFPSVLKSLQIINIEEPSEIFISTPGPIGLLGLLFSRLFNIRCTGIHHPGMNLEISESSQDAPLTQLVENYSFWFFSQMKVIKANPQSYKDILECRELSF